MVKWPSANARDTGLIPHSGRSPAGGNGYPFQCSCLENPTVRATWCAIVYGVAKSRSQLSTQASRMCKSHPPQKSYLWALFILSPSVLGHLRSHVSSVEKWLLKITSIQSSGKFRRRTKKSSFPQDPKVSFVFVWLKVWHVSARIEYVQPTIQGDPDHGDKGKRIFKGEQLLKITWFSLTLPGIYMH